MSFDEARRQARIGGGLKFYCADAWTVGTWLPFRTEEIVAVGDQIIARRLNVDFIIKKQTENQEKISRQETTFSEFFNATLLFTDNNFKLNFRRL